MSDRLISICVPTFKREYIVRDMLKSIYSQDVDHSLFEVCITDNSETDETKDMIEKEFSGIDNLFYKKTTCKGFLNSTEALKFGTGEFLKLHNDYSIFKPGALKKMIEIVQRYREIKPVIFFGMKEIDDNKMVKEYDTFDNFMNHIHYFSTWSTSFSIWKCDLDQLLKKGIEVNYMYPHTSLLFQLNDKQKYIVDNYEYVTNLQPKRKGGYNLIDNFVRIYLTMLEDDLLNKALISEATYRKIKKNILKFVAYWYCTVQHSDNYTFTFENRAQIIKGKYGFLGIVRFYYYYSVCLLKHYIKKVLRR